MCFVWIWKQRAIISLYSINWLVFINETVCVYCAVRNKCLYSLHLQSNPVITHRFMRHPVYNVRYSAVSINSSLLPITLHSSVIKALVYNDRNYSVIFIRYMRVQCVCFVWVSEQTAIISLYSIKWFVFVMLRRRNWIFKYYVNEFHASKGSWIMYVKFLKLARCVTEYIYYSLYRVYTKEWCGFKS